jgi:hypothetical protein
MRQFGTTSRDVARASVTDMAGQDWAIDETSELNPW